MKTILLLFLVGVLSLAVAAPDPAFVAQQTKVAAALTALPVDQCKCYLYSLNPKKRNSDSVNTDQIFHGFTILGRAEITDPADKGALLAAFAKGVRDSDGRVVAGFHPRHGIRLVNGDTTYDFVICYECFSVTTYGFNFGRGFMTSAAPAGVFNGFLDQYHLQRAKN